MKVFEDQQFIEESVEHWERMIEWASQRDPEEQVSACLMKILLQEDWYSRSCPLCRRFLFLGDGDCSDCPLRAVFGECDNPCSLNAWIDVAKAETWGEWLEAAEVMLLQLKVILKLLKEGGDNV